jgi:pyochelin synthetase
VGYPSAYATFLTSAFNTLPDLVTGAVTVQSLLFADGDVEAATGAYGENIVSRHLNEAVAGLAVHRARRHPERALRILELGGGVAVTATAVTHALSREELAADYLLTDVSPFFLDRALSRLGQPLRGNLSTALLDINDVGEDGRLRGEQSGEFDLLIAANVLHNAVDLPTTLTALAAELARGGLVVIIDTTRELTQLLASMAFLMSTDADPPGSRDERADTDQIMVSASAWQDQLRTAGLEPHGILPDEDHPLSRTGISLIVAERTVAQ